MGTEVNGNEEDGDEDDGDKDDGNEDDGDEDDGNRRGQQVRTLRTGDWRRRMEATVDTAKKTARSYAKLNIYDFYRIQ